jgi:hypothetical protein
LSVNTLFSSARQITVDAAKWPCDGQVSKHQTGKTKMVEFNSDSHEMSMKIASRAKGMNPRVNVMSCAMDIAAADGVNGNMPLDLVRLYSADDMNFSHDVFGILRHIDRYTGKIGGFFVPRFANAKANA